MLASGGRCIVTSHTFECFLPTDYQSSEGKFKVTKGVYKDLIEQTLAILLKSQDPQRFVLMFLIISSGKKKTILFFPGWFNNGSVFSF